MNKFTLIGFIFLVAGGLNLVTAFMSASPPKLLFGISSAILFMAAVIFFVKGRQIQ